MSTEEVATDCPSVAYHEEGASRSTTPPPGGLSPWGEINIIPNVSG